MAGELDAALAALITLLGQISDFRLTPDNPPGNLGAFPALVVSPASGQWPTKAGSEVKGLHTIRIGAYVQQTSDLARDVARVLPLGEKIKDKLLIDANVGLSGTIDTINNEGLNYVFGPVDYASQSLIGWTIEMEVKISSVESNGAFVKG